MIEQRLLRQRELVGLFFTAQAFVVAAEQLIEPALQQEEDDLDISEETRVILHLTYLGVELFLKAGLAASGFAYPKNHDLRILRQRYLEGGIELPIELPHFLSSLLGDLHPDLPGLAPLPLARHFERYRYACDHDGRPFPPLPPTDLNELRCELERLRGSAMARLYPIVLGWREKGHGDFDAADAR